PSSCSRPQDFFHWGGPPASVSTSSRRGRWIRNEPARIRFDFREIGNWTSGVGTKVAEKNAFSSPYREQLNPLVEFSRPKTSAKSAGFGSPGAPEVRRPNLAGGESGIRTHGTVSRTHAFQACALSHSAISPEGLS